MIITLCGSVRFLHLLDAWNEALSRCGHAVFGLGMRTRSDSRPSPEDKLILDNVHRQKIAASDAVLVLNRFAYIGESTMSEVNYALSLGKEVRFLESWATGCGVGRNHTAEARELALSFGIPPDYTSPIDTCNYNTCPHDWLGGQGFKRSALVGMLNAARLMAPR